ncbi:unnamed protein product [Dovyalis caffra]|uniref:Uncharacterized protein n=1 Tax=Dovyalis caffra TaxID=77055 RepID=A0AAV1R2V8_9ROSI|nr:unnamed protein product [Dovyalis caffra]
MALTNLIITVAGVSAVILLLRSDVKQSASIFRRNVKHIRNWLEEESAAASKIEVNNLVWDSNSAGAYGFEADSNEQVAYTENGLLMHFISGPQKRQRQRNWNQRSLKRTFRRRTSTSVLYPGYAVVKESS